MIIVHATIPVRSDARERALEVAKAMAEASRLEGGCISYEFYVGLSDPNVLMLFQEWETMEALMGHFEMEHFEIFMRELPDMVAGDVITRRYAVQSVEEDASETQETPPIIH